MSNATSIAQAIRYLSLEMTTLAGSGHPTSCLSIAEILAVFFSDVYTFDPGSPHNLYNDRFILSKGHAAPALYAAYALSGFIPRSELSTLRKKNSRLEGHPTRELPFVDVATGSLGQGLAVGVGMAQALKDLPEAPYVYVLLGDGELAEGSNWEAFALASHYKLKKIVGIVDLNNLGQTGPSLYAQDAYKLKARATSFGWHAHIVDGHDTSALKSVFEIVKNLNGPHLVICQTIKGKGVPFLEGKPGWHGKALNQEQLAQVFETIKLQSDISIHVKKPLRFAFMPQVNFGKTTLPPIFSKNMATKYASSLAIADAVRDHPDVVCIDADVQNSTHLDMAFTQEPNQCTQAYIAEGAMVGMATGMDVVGKRVIISTFSAFLTRAFDQLRMTAISRRSLVIHGSYAGVSVGRDGASQMGLEDIAMMRTLPGMIVVIASDAYSAYSLTRNCIRQKSLAYIRTAREPTSVLYTQTTLFPIGGSHLHSAGDQDVVTIVSAGITVYEALLAQQNLKIQGILVRVVDLYSIKPLDVVTLKMCAKQTKGKFVVVEDHRLEGGVGEAVRNALNGEKIDLRHLGVVGIPHSQSPQEALHMHQIDALAIETAVKELLLF